MTGCDLHTVSVQQERARTGVRHGGKGTCEMVIFLGVGLQLALVIAGLLMARAALTTARTPQGAAA